MAGDGQPGTSARVLLLDLLRPHRVALASATLLMLVQSAATLAMPWLAGRFSGALLAAQPVAGVLLALFGLVVAQSLLSFLVAIRMQDVTTGVVADGSMRLFDHLQALPLGWHQERRRGEVLALLTEDIERLGWFATGTLARLLPLLLTCVGALLLMLRIAPGIGIGIALLVPAIYLSMRLAGRRMRPLGREVANAYAQRAAMAEQNLAMLPVVKAFVGESMESTRFHRGIESLRMLRLRQARLHALVGPLVRISAAAVVLALLWLASREIAAGALATADMVSLLLYGMLLTQPVSELAGVYGQAQSARGAADRLLQAFSEAPEPVGGTHALARTRGAIEFEGVVFAYQGRDPVLGRLDLQVAAGETIAITGANGAGKSTLVHLLMRFADPQSGRILLDGIDLRELRMRDLRAQVGLVAQNVLLFNATVGENIAYGRPGIGIGEIREAAHAARAHDFVTRLPQGYDTLIGDQGVKLSGGQKQRIALARALLKDPPVLVLDEATAMFDPEGEAEFIAESHDALRGRTVILITHRPASLALADRVLRMQDGLLVAVP